MNGIGKTEDHDIDIRKRRGWGKIKDQKRKWEEGRCLKYQVKRNCNRTGRIGNGMKVGEMEEGIVKERKVGEREVGM